jgi:soluble lytic murein transglycosylase
MSRAGSYNRHVIDMQPAGSDRRKVARRLALALAATGAVFTLGTPALNAGQAQSQATAPPASFLVATSHPPLPSDLSLYWLVPDAAYRPGAQRRPLDAGLRRLAQGVQLVAKEDYAGGLPLVSGADVAGSPLADYARYYAAVALAGMGRHQEAVAALSALAARQLDGTLKELVPLRLAEEALAVQDPLRAERVLTDLSQQPRLSSPEDIWLQRARIEQAAGHKAHALESYRKVYYDYPLSAQAAIAQDALTRLSVGEPPPPDFYPRELGRAERLFAGRRWADARDGYKRLGVPAFPEDRELIALRLAECQHYLGDRRAAREALKPWLTSRVHGAEARYFYLTATRLLGDRAAYVQLAGQLVDDEPRSEWTERTLDELATHYITTDQDDKADQTMRDLLRLFPRSRFSERAAWKVGWAAYRSQRFAETAQVFEQAAAAFPRSDYRPSWLYWSGRARDRMSDRPTASARYRLTVVDYQNSYYGRLAANLLQARGEPAVTARIAAAPPSAVLSAPVATTTIIRELVLAQMYDDALREVQYAQRVFGDSPQLQATSAWVRHQQGQTLTAQERFNALRGAITTMRRAYPQFMAAGGEGLPPDVLRVIFPLDYWPLITKYSLQHGLDPFLIAALMAQESTFTAEIRSHANAYGLMQIIPGTGRTYARKLGITPFSTAMLQQPEINVRIGTQYFKELVTQFGGAHFALAGYNAGERRVERWLAERPGIPQDEFIDDIPFPETQGYVKRILGTAEDYRALYGQGRLDPMGGATPAAAAPAASAVAPAPSAAEPAARELPASVKKTLRSAPKAPAKKAPARRPARRPAAR